MKIDIPENWCIEAAEKELETLEVGVMACNPDSYITDKMNEPKHKINFEYENYELGGFPFCGDQETNVFVTVHDQDYECPICHKKLKLIWDVRIEEEE